jgi:outer membrane protein assembly factor BamB
VQFVSGQVILHYLTGPASGNTAIALNSWGVVNPKDGTFTQTWKVALDLQGIPPFTFVPSYFGQLTDAQRAFLPLVFPDGNAFFQASVSGGVIFVSTTFGGNFYGYSSTTGALLWSVDLNTLLGGEFISSQTWVQAVADGAIVFFDAGEHSTIWWMKFDAKGVNLWVQSLAGTPLFVNSIQPYAVESGLLFGKAT